MTKTNPITNAPAEQSPAAALWRIVVSEYEQANATFEQNWAAYEAAEKAVENSEAGRRKTELAERYGLRDSMTTDEALISIDHVIAARDYPNGTGGADLPDEVVDKQCREAERILGEYRGLNAATMIIAEQRKVGELRDAHFAFVHEVYDPTRFKLFATPAPDIAAVLFKAEVLADYSDDAEGLRDDLNRLFGGK